MSQINSAGTPAPEPDATAAAVNTSGMAITAMILGILGLLATCLIIGFPVALAGLVLGIVALVRISKPTNRLKGNGFAITGIVCGGVSFLLLPLGIGILLPALGAARNAAHQEQAVVQARHILQGCILYTHNANVQHYPADLMTLVDQKYVTTRNLLSPFAATQVPSGFATWPRNRQAQWLRQNASYVLIPGLTDDMNTDEVAVFLKPRDSVGKGIAVIFNDARGEWLPQAQVDALLRRQIGKSLQQLVAESEAPPPSASP